MVRFLASALALLLLLPAAALADGKVFRYGIAEPPAIPDQQAIIAWDANTSTQMLVIETRFDAAPGNQPPPDGSSPYAWVVPLPGPAAPEVSAATTGLFPTVRQIFQPRVIDHRSPTGLWMTVPLTLVILGGVWLTTVRKANPLVVLLAGLLGFTCIGIVLLPTLGSASRSLSGGSSGVDVLARSIVGSYDVAVIGAAQGDAAPADSGKALGAWLKDNGYTVPSGAEPVLADYAARRWVFAATKLRPDAGAPSGRLTPHPLVFKFKTDQPVYPMRLTGVGNGPLRLDLYIFGHERAHAPNMAEVRCDRCMSGSDYEKPFVWPVAGVIAVAHPLLKQVAGKAAVATKLSATLSPAQQSADLNIGWAPFRASGGEKHSPRSAIFEAIDLGGAVVPAFLVVLIIIGAARRLDGAWVLRRAGWAVVPAMIVGPISWALTPTVATRGDGRQVWRSRTTNLSYIGEEVARILAHDAGRTSGTPSLEAIERTAAAVARELRVEWRNEDSPFNYRIEGTDGQGQIDLITYNTYGAATRTRIWPPIAQTP